MNALSRPRRFGIWIVIALLLGGGAVYFAKTSRQAPTITLESAPIVRGTLIDSISSTGSLSPQLEVTVGTQVSGTITKVLVDYNSEVKKGDLLAVVDPQTLQAQLITAKAAMIKAQAQYDEAKRQLNEGKPLRDQGYLSTRDMRTLEVAEQTAKAQLDSSRADYERQNVQLQYAEVRSPIDGVVESRTVDPGNTVQAAMTAPTLFVIASDLSKMKILATVDETQIAAIKVGMPAHFSVSGIADRTFNAVVKQVRLKSAVTNNVVTYTVVLDAENPGKVLFPGMTATIDFIISNLEDKLLVPNGALQVRIPEELRAEDVNSSKRAQGSTDAAQAPPRGSVSGTANGGSLNNPGNGAANARAAPRMNRHAVWLVNAAGKAHRVPVRVLASDLINTAIEPLHEGQLNEGEMIVTRVVDPNNTPAPNANQGQNRRSQMNLGAGFGGPRG